MLVQLHEAEGMSLRAASKALGRPMADIASAAVREYLHGRDAGPTVGDARAELARWMRPLVQITRRMVVDAWGAESEDAVWRALVGLGCAERNGALVPPPDPVSERRAALARLL